jgi:hypothetical protein
MLAFSSLPSGAEDCEVALGEVLDIPGKLQENLEDVLPGA